MVRGNDRRDIFTTEEDRARFCALLAEGLERFGHRVHAFCLMTNHVHLAVQVEDAPLSAIMQALAGRYTQWFNRRHGRVGHLFQGRYKALMVEAESYLFALIGYIHRNPLEAGLVRRARDYPWSSHPSYLGLASTPWLTTDWLLAQLSPDLRAARRQLDALVERSEPRDLFAEVRHGLVLGSEVFTEAVLSKASGPAPGDLAPEDLLEAVAREYRLTASDLAQPGKAQPAAEARAVLAWLVRRTPGASMEGAARSVGRAAASLSAAATRLEARLAQDAALARRVEGLRRG
jgi:REP element-mobilizing transposase RayT